MYVGLVHGWFRYYLGLVKGFFRGWLGDYFELV